MGFINSEIAATSVGDSSLGSSTCLLGITKVCPGVKRGEDKNAEAKGFVLINLSANSVGSQKAHSFNNIRLSIIS
jgi:hypothetical protein